MHPHVYPRPKHPTTLRHVPGLLRLVPSKSKQTDLRVIGIHQLRDQPPLTPIVVDLSARTTGPSVAHLPEVVLQRWQCQGDTSRKAPALRAGRVLVVCWSRVRAALGGCCCLPVCGLRGGFWSVADGVGAVGWSVAASVLPRCWSGAGQCSGYWSGAVGGWPCSCRVQVGCCQSPAGCWSDAPPVPEGSHRGTVSCCWLRGGVWAAADRVVLGCCRLAGCCVRAATALVACSSERCSVRMVPGEESTAPRTNRLTSNRQRP